jgi:hypothetical protein
MGDEFDTLLALDFEEFQGLFGGDGGVRSIVEDFGFFG